MTHRKSRAPGVALLALLVTLSGCQFVKKLTGRGGNDAGSSTHAPLGDAGGPSPVIALPNPTVAPLPTTAPTPPSPPPDVVQATEDASLAVADAPTATPDDAPVVAVVDGGAVPTDLEGNRRRRRGLDNYCKEHPGRVHPRTHIVCPM